MPHVQFGMKLLGVELQHRPQLRAGRRGQGEAGSWARASRRCRLQLLGDSRSRPTSGWGLPQELVAVLRGGSRLDGHLHMYAEGVATKGTQTRCCARPFSSPLHGSRPHVYPPPPPRRSPQLLQRGTRLPALLLAEVAVEELHALAALGVHLALAKGVQQVGRQRLRQGRGGWVGEWWAKLQ